MRVIKIAMLVAAAVTLFGCQVTSMTVKSPGHTSSPGVIGYYKRYPHHHRYDDNLGLYIYLESPDTYYSNNYYYRWSITLGHWERAHEPRGKWRRAYEHQIPSKLYKKRLKRKKKFKKRAKPASHAPSYGYYKKYPHRHRYDNDLGVYIFLESPYTYYNNDHYIRWSVKLNRWERATEPYGNWRQVHERNVPPRLIKRRVKTIKRNNGRSKTVIKKVITKERNYDRKESRKERKAWKKEQRNNRREYLEECDDDQRRGRSGKCRD